MFRTFLYGICAVIVTANTSFAQVTEGGATEETAAALDCSDPNNAAEAECLGLPPIGDEITNFVPLIGPLLGAGALAALTGGGGTDGTTNTTGTVSTTN